jgi:hypothetical protein
MDVPEKNFERATESPLLGNGATEEDLADE